MPISDDQLRAYLEEFQDEADEGWQQERLEKKQELGELLAEDDLDEFGEGSIRELIRNLWAFESWTNKDYLVEQVLNAGEEEVRDQMTAAVTETQDHGTAFDELLEIPQFGPATASEILSFLHSTECAIINRPTREGLDTLSYGSDIPSRINTGEDYVEYMALMQDVLERVEENMDVESPTVVLDDFIDLDYFLWWLSEKETEGETTGEGEDEGFDVWSHNDVQDMLETIGDGLGFQVRKEYEAAPRARIDVVWKTRIANLGSIGYAFEVHNSGQEDSAILNIQKAINEDPDIQRGVIVSTPEQLEDFRNEIRSLGDFANAVSYLSVGDVAKADRLQSELRDILREANLAD